MSEALVPAAAEPVGVADGEADVVLPSASRQPVRRYQIPRTWLSVPIALGSLKVA